jgi:hypothetical protein
MKKAILLLILFVSCKTHIATNYKITQDKRNYYVNSFEVINDSLCFSELDRSGQPHGSYKIPYCGVVIRNKY